MNQFFAFRKWWPVASAMQPMIESLYRDPGKGFLAAESFVYWPGAALVQYWRCFEDLDRFSRALTDDREKAVAEKGKVDPAVVASSIYRGIGTLDQVREHIIRMRRETGISYFCLRGPHAEELAPVVTDLSGT